MNCETFNSLVGRHSHDGNASGEFTNDYDHVDFDAHAKSCSDCAATLAGDNQLALMLRSMRHATRNVSAPANLETALREKFRSHSTAVKQNMSASQSESLNTPAMSRNAVLFAAIHTNNKNKLAPAARATRNAPPNSLTTNPMTTRKNWMGWQHLAPRAAAFISALLLFAVALVAVVRHDSNSNAGSIQLTTTPVNLVDDTALSIANSVNERATNTSTSIASSASERSEPANSYSPAPSAVMPVFLSSISNHKSNGAKRAGEIQSGRRNAKTKSRAGNQSHLNSSPEIATAFLPLVEAESLAGIESGHIMRVEMPREALVSFGLPMNQERAGELVKADVLLGDDGVARAIRFVR